MKNLAGILSLLVVLMAWSCSHGDTYGRILRAEAVLDSFPDSALTLMRSIDSSRLRGERERAMYALTLSRAEDRNYIDRTDDSLITIAVRYFDGHDDPRRRMLANFYHGRVLVNARDYPKATLKFIKSFEMAQELSDDFWCGKNAGELSDIFLKTYRTNDCLEYAKKSTVYFERISDSKYRNFSYVSLAGAYLNNNNDKEALETCLRASDSIALSSDKWMVHLLHRIMVKSYFNLTEYEKAVEIVDKMDNDSVFDADILYYGRAAALLSGKKEEDSIALSVPTPAMFLYQYTKGLRHNDVAMTVDALKSLLRAESDSLQSALNVGFNSAFTEALNQEETMRELERDNAEKEKMILFLSCAISFIILLSVGLYIYKIQHNKILSFSDKINEEKANTRQLRETLGIVLASKEESKTKLNEILCHRFYELDRFCSTYFALFASSKNSAIKKIINEFIDSYSENEDMIKELECFVDLCHNNLMTSFRQMFPDLKNADYLLFLYTALRFSANTVALLLKVDKLEVVYNRKARLKRKIKAMDSQECQKFYDFLS